MNLINQSSWAIGREHDISTDLEEALLEKIEHMEARIEELESDLEKEKDSHSKTDDDWQDRYDRMKHGLEVDIAGYIEQIEELEQHIQDIQKD